jgi:hypothetical protein
VVEVEEVPEEVRPEVEVEEDPEEVQQEDPVEQPQLYDGTILEADADGDLVIPPAPDAAYDAPHLRQFFPHLMLWVEIQMTQEMRVVKMMMRTITTMLVKIQRRRKIIILAIVGLSTIRTLLRMRMASFVSYWRKCCSIWVSL